MFPFIKRFLGVSIPAVFTEVTALSASFAVVISPSSILGVVTFASAIFGVVTALSLIPLVPICVNKLICFTLFYF